MSDIIECNPHCSARQKYEQQVTEGGSVGNKVEINNFEHSHITNKWSSGDEKLFQGMSVFYGNLTVTELDEMWSNLSVEEKVSGPDLTLSNTEMELEEFRDTSHYSQMCAVLITARSSGNHLIGNVNNLCTVPAQPGQQSPSLFNRHMLRNPAVSLASSTTHLYNISAANYNRIINENQNLLTVLNKLGNVFRAVNVFKSKLTTCNKEKRMDDSELRGCVWGSIVAADQKYFPGEPVNCQTSTNHGIKLVLARKTNVILPFLSDKSPLLSRLVWTLHKENTNVPPLRVIHHPQKSVHSWLGSINIGVYIDNAEKKISEILKYCSICARVNVLYYSNIYGSRIKFSSEDGLYENVYLDPTGPWRIRAHSKARGPSVHCFGLFFVCQSTGCCDMILVEGITAKDIARGIVLLQYKANCVIKRITCDAGTSLSESLLTENNRFSFTVKQLNVKHQSRSLSESRYRSYKSIFRRVMGQYKHNDGSYVVNMTAVELMLTMEMVTLSCNLIPYNKGDILSPAYFRYHPQIIQHWEKDDLSGSKIFEKYTHVFEELKRVRRDTINSITNFDVKFKYYKQKGRKDVRPAGVGDIIFYPSKPTATLARIVEINSDHVCTIYTGSRTIQVPIKELTLIHPNLENDRENNLNLLNIMFMSERKVEEFADTITGAFQTLHIGEGNDIAQHNCKVNIILARIKVVNCTLSSLQSVISHSGDFKVKTMFWTIIFLGCICNLSMAAPVLNTETESSWGDRNVTFAI